VAPHPLSDVVVVSDQPSPTWSCGSPPSSENTEKHSSNASSRTSVNRSDGSASPTSDNSKRDRDGKQSGHNDDASAILGTAAPHTQPGTDLAVTASAASDASTGYGEISATSRIDATTSTSSIVPSVPSTADSSDDDNEVFFDALE
jgi:hypothetical protein